MLSHIIPYDRQAIDTSLTIAEAAQRLRAATVKRHWIRILASVPGTFEGAVADDRFCVLTSAEGYKVLGLARIRNLGRPVCAGRLVATPGGCRINVTLRPQAVVMAVLAYLFVFSMILVPLAPRAAWLQAHIDPKLPAAFPVVFVLNYAIGTAAFWVMRNRAIKALRAVLDA